MKYTRNLCMLTIAICFCSELLSQTIVDPLNNSLSNSRSITPNNPPMIQESLDVFLIELSIQQNLSLNLLRESFEDFKPQTTAKQYVAPVGARAKKNWRTYQANVLDPNRLAAGKKFWTEHEIFLKQLERERGIPPEIILSILGIETIYGKNMGNFVVKDVLTTLAFDYPPTPNQVARKALFKSQLGDLIIYCSKKPNHVASNASDHQHTPVPVIFKKCLNQPSSFAGAIGMPQFMPTSILQYALDGNGDNLIDLRNQAQDAIASIANFLLMHGWQVGQPATLPITQGVQSLDITKQLADGDPNPKLSLDMLKKAGIVSDWPKTLNDQSPALIVDLPSTDKAGNDLVEYIVGLKNFEVITQYNRSFFYAMAVLDFAKAISAVISPTNFAGAQPQPIKSKKSKK